jgi:hypothetical protein
MLEASFAWLCCTFMLMQSSTILVTGGSGLVGTALTRLLVDLGYRVIILSRKSLSSNNPLVSYAQWNITEQTINKTAIQQADYIVHLAGAGVADKRWTDKRKKEIVDSRVQSSQLLVKALTENQHTVKAVVSASGIGWYGEDPSIPNPTPFVETDPPDVGFLGETCKLWEAAIQPVTQLNIRLVTLRTSLVFSNHGGAFKEFRKHVNIGIAPLLGGGKQTISWIHIHDMCRVIIASLQNENMRGAFNAATAEPVSNKTLMLAIGRKLKGKMFLPVHVPSFILKMFLGEMSVEILKSTTVTNRKLKETGFQFTYPTLEAALNELCSY